MQLHCPPDEVYLDDPVFEALDEMVDAGRIRAYGVSVETCQQALAAIARPHVRPSRSSSTASASSRSSRCFRPHARPASASLPGCRSRGLLSGRYDEHTCSPPTTTGATTVTARRSTSARRLPACRSRSAFAAARELKGVVDPGTTLAQFALRWIIDQPGVQHRDPGGPQRRAGGAERVRGRARHLAHRAARRGPRRLRPTDSRARSRPLVGDPRPSVVPASRVGDRAQHRE